MQVHFQPTPEDSRLVAKSCSTGGFSLTVGWLAGISVASLLPATAIVIGTREWSGLVLPILVVTGLTTWIVMLSRRCSNPVQEDVTLTITPTAIEQVTPSQRSRASWAGVDTVHEIPGFVVMRWKLASFLYVPRRAFASSDDMHHFAEEALRFQRDYPVDGVLDLAPVADELNRGTASVTFSLAAEDLKSIPPLGSAVGPSEPSQPKKSNLSGWLLLCCFFVLAVLMWQHQAAGPTPRKAGPGSFVLVQIIGTTVTLGAWLLLMHAAGQRQQRWICDLLPKQPFTMTLTPNAILLYSDRTQELRQWSGVAGLAENSQLLSVWLTNGSVQVVPRRAFASSYDVEQFASQIRHYISAAAPAMDNNPYRPPSH